MVEATQKLPLADAPLKDKDPEIFEMIANEKKR